MKKTIKLVSLLTLLLTFVFVSCKKDEPEPETNTEVAEKVNKVAVKSDGTNGKIYNGVFNSDTLQSFDFNVKVTKLADNKIKIEPQGEGTAFEVTMSLSANSFLNGDVGQVVFTENPDGTLKLTYNYNSGEQFVGDEVN